MSVCVCVCVCVCANVENRLPIKNTSMYTYGTLHIGKCICSHVSEGREKRVREERKGGRERDGRKEGGKKGGGREGRRKERRKEGGRGRKERRREGREGRTGEGEPVYENSLCKRSCQMKHLKD